MRAPRRTPYGHPDELEQVYRLLYPGEECDIILDEEHRKLREQGLAIVQVWLNRSCCPHAVESTNSLIQAQNLDQKLLQLPSTSTFSHDSSAEWIVRSAYSMAIVRFVNSVVDAYQTALYAQSIFQISQRIGLPAHLVEIRHAATHEDLPNLDVLRKACLESLRWLQFNFWQPNIDKKADLSQSANGQFVSSLDEVRSTIEMDEIRRIHGEELMRCIARYRRIAKKVTKDVSLKGRYRVSLVNAEKKIEACVKQMALEMRRVYGATFSESESRASFLVAEALLEEGGIVPLSKRKRSHTEGTEQSATLPTRLLQVWLPLLKHLTDSFEAFNDALQEEMVKRIISSNQSKSSSYLDTIAGWLMMLYGNNQPLLNSSQDLKDSLLYSDMSEEDREDTTTEKSTLSLARKLLTGQSARALSLVRQLCKKDSDLEDKVAPLLELAQASFMFVDTTMHQASASGQIDVGGKHAVETETSSVERSIAEMEKNLQSLEERIKVDESQLASNLEVDHIESTDSRRVDEQLSICDHLPGWHVASSDWKPTPIGCLNGSVPNLLLAL